MLSDFSGKKKKLFRTEENGNPYSKYWKRKKKNLLTKNSVSGEAVYTEMKKGQTFPSKQMLKEFTTT